MDVAVIGAGVVGAACAYFAAEAGLRVAVLDRGQIVSGTTSAGEGNLLVSDKEPGPELQLAMLSTRLWAQLAAEHGDVIEYERKGGLVVAADQAGLVQLQGFAARQRAAGVEAETVSPDQLRTLEPDLARGLAGGVLYPQDAQVQPMLAAATLLKLARQRGAIVHTATTVTGLSRSDDGRITGVTAGSQQIPAGCVVNAAGTWAGEIAAIAGVTLPIMPRRGFILVTQPVPLTVLHKVYGAGYTDNVASHSAALQTSPVVEGTKAGTILIGASRERVGFDRTFSLPVLSRLAAQALTLFPALADTSVIRAYLGFRPYLPDHLPAIGPDPRAPHLFHACGHEGAGIGLALATGQLVTQAITASALSMDLTPFNPGRFDLSAEPTLAVPPKVPRRRHE